MNHKSRCWDLDKVCAQRGAPIRIAISVDRDRYLKHHRGEAVQRFHLMASRIGELIVLGDRDTVFGELDAPSERLPPEYRAHGSLHEMDVPLLIFNAHAQLKPEDFQHNRDLARWLYACKLSISRPGPPADCCPTAEPDLKKHAGPSVPDPEAEKF